MSLLKKYHPIDIANEIGNCSEIISAASKLQNANLRNQIFKYVGEYREELRTVYDRIQFDTQTMLNGNFKLMKPEGN